MFSNILAVILIQFACLIDHISSLSITVGNCQKNISIKYQVPVTKTRLSRYYNHYDKHSSQLPIEHYTDYEERIRWDTIKMCCPGYRTILFDLCQPICEQPCPVHSYCTEPNKCICKRGYEPSHLHTNHREHLIQCRPICLGGCPLHSHCIDHNKCECRIGYRDVSAWLKPIKCARIHCGPEQRYDIHKKSCIKIEMSVEELMQKVAERITNGFTDTYDMDYDSSTDE